LQVTTVDDLGARLRKAREDAGVSLAALAARTHYSKPLLGMLETGKRTIKPDHVAAYSRALNIAIDTHYGEERREDSSSGSYEDDPVLDRRSVLCGPRVTAEDIEALRGTISHLVALDGRHGGEELARLARRAFQSAHTRLSTGACPSSLEHDFETVTSELAELTGWLLFDAERQTEARAMNMEALNLSRLAGDESMELFTLSNQAMVSVHMNQPREALRIADSVLDHIEVSGRVAALFRVRRARALAALGAGGEAVTEIGRARALLDEGIGVRDPNWTWWIDGAELAWHDGMLHASLGDWATALPGFGHAVNACAPTYHRGLYVHRAYLLEALIRLGSWPDAERTLLEVLPMVGAVGSARTVRVLRRVAALTAQAGPAVPSTVRDAAGELQRRLDLV
jgi:transcriptional regulator with XRE-family HTH domain